MPVPLLFAARAGCCGGALDELKEQASGHAPGVPAVSPDGPCLRNWREMGQGGGNLPPAQCAAVAAAYRRRWGQMLAVVLQGAFAASPP